MGTEPHPLLVGKTPKELEDLSAVDFAAHISRTKQYLAVLEREELVRIIMDNEQALSGYPSIATDRYKAAWHIARRRKGLPSR